MTHDWQQLTAMTGGRPVIVERVRVVHGGISIEGQFELPPLARLTMEDQVFAAAFLRSHGSIKEMERTFGVSYPTIKNRLNRIASAVGLVEVLPSAKPGEVLERLEKGEITVDEAMKELKK